jgi:AraC-like DNA-binding protein
MSKRNIEREKEIINLIDNNWTLTTIATKFNITKQRVGQIAKKNNISIWNKIRTKKKTMHQNILNDINNDIQYKDIIKKYNLPKSKLSDSFKSIQKESLTTFIMNKRNNEITSQFIKGTTAKIITNKTEPILISPTHLTSVGSIYRINTKNNIRRYPQIINRHKGGLFESKEVIKLIKNKRDKKNWTFKQIAEELNKLGYKTITGKEYTEPNTYQKYLAIKQNKKIAI